ncbi:MAG: BatA domain-containing protein [Isosphaerales bacterium]
MSFLTPLYVLGLAAVVGPILFHLIRRSPRGEVPFSSLMFLSPTPPRLTRRSRLDHLLLLALRAAALCLVAMAFARPFLRQAARLDYGDVERRRIAVLIDTSASMRRGDLWPRAVALARKVIADCRPGDHLAVFSFDATSRPLLGFHESMTLDPARRQAVALALLDQLAPSWGGTNLGQALIDAVAAIEDVADASEKTGRMPRSIVLISDLAQGSRLDALGDFEWPSDVELDLKTVSDHGSNAGLQLLADSVENESSAAALQHRVRVFNDPSSRQEKFELLWVDEKGIGKEKPIDVYVPAGESRVVRVPRPHDPASSRSLQLKGDAHGFDNTLFFADGIREDSTVIYIGTDRADDPTGPLYFLERVFLDTPRRSVRILPQLPGAVLAWEPDRPPPLVVLTAETTPENIRRLQQYVKDGGTLLYVVTAPGRAATLAALAGVPPWSVAESAPGRDVMLGEIAFDHPLFAPFAGAQFNDFTKIHFWKYRRIDTKVLGDARVLARFETGDAAIVEKSAGKGKLVVLASGWQPADSQLARSSKFVPLMTALLEARDPRPSGGENHIVFDRVPLPAGADSAKALVVHKPDGAVVTLAPGELFFSETDQPGLYTVDTPRGARSFAVNLDPIESKTAPLDETTLEQYRVHLADHSPKRLDHEQIRQMYNMELENRQKLWRWLILAAIGVLIVETWLAGRSRVRRRAAVAEALVT